MYCPEMPEAFLIDTSAGCFAPNQAKEQKQLNTPRYRVLVKPPASAQVFEKRSGLGKFPQKAAESGAKGICISAKKEGVLKAPLREN